MKFDIVIFPLPQLFIPRAVGHVPGATCPLTSANKSVALRILSCTRGAGRPVTRGPAPVTIASTRGHPRLSSADTAHVARARGQHAGHDVLVAGAGADDVPGDVCVMDAAGGGAVPGRDNIIISGES